VASLFTNSIPIPNSVMPSSLSSSSCFILAVVLAVAAPLPSSSAFLSPKADIASRPSILLLADNDNQSSVNEEDPSFRFPNPLAELADMFSNFDDIVDDFFNKRVSRFMIHECIELVEFVLLTVH
jgi:hypothetical protein